MRLPLKISFSVALCAGVLFGLLSCEERDATGLVTVEVTLMAGREYNDYAYTVATDTSSRILAAGFRKLDSSSYANFAITRVLTSGALDTSFYTTGRLAVSIGTGFSTVTSIEVFPDEKIWLVGIADLVADVDRGFAMARLLSDGSFDTSFSTDGKHTSIPADSVWIAIHSVASSDGTFVIGTVESGSLFRYLPSGTLDTSFFTKGYRAYLSHGYDGVMHVANAPSSGYYFVGSRCDDTDPGISVACNYSAGLFRIRSDGSLDTGFSTSGTAIASISSSDFISRTLVVDSDQKIVTAGYAERTTTQNDFMLMRFHTDGSRDNTFGTNGIVLTNLSSENGRDHIRSVFIQSDAKIIGAGYSTIGTQGVFALARYLSNGELDTSFGTTGTVLTSFGAAGATGLSPTLENGAYGLRAARLPDGKIVIAGSAFNGTNSDFAFAMYWP